VYSVSIPSTLYCKVELPRNVLFEGPFLPHEQKRKTIMGIANSFFISGNKFNYFLPAHELFLSLFTVEIVSISINRS
jgi:hypothetical protein